MCGCLIQYSGVLGLQRRGAGASSWALSGFTAGIEICLPSTQHIGEWDSFWFPLCVVLLTEPKPVIAIAQSSGVQSFFLFYSQKHSEWLSHLLEGLSFQKGSPDSWTTLGFHSVLPGSHSSHRGTFSHGWVSNYFYWEGRHWGTPNLAILLTSFFLLTYFWCDYAETSWNIE